MGANSRGNIQKQGKYQQGRYEGQVDPIIKTATQGYQNSVAQNQADYGRMMGQYQDTFKTGGFSPMDVAAMRSRAISPIRAAYANAERNINRMQGQHPGRAALTARMAREQGQAGAEATTGADAQIAQMRSQNRNAAMQGATSLYGATPGMASMFGNQALQGTGQSGQFGSNMMQAGIEGEKLPGAYDTTMGRAKDIYGTAATVAYPWLKDKPWAAKVFGQDQQQPNTGIGPSKPPTPFAPVNRNPQIQTLGQQPKPRLSGGFM